MFLTAMARFEEAETEFEKTTEARSLSLITITLSLSILLRQTLRESCGMFAGSDPMDICTHGTWVRIDGVEQQRNFERAIIEVASPVINDRDAIAALGYVQGLAGDTAGAGAACRTRRTRRKTVVSAYVESW
jgi:hypothetical protein